MNRRDFLLLAPAARLAAQVETRRPDRARLRTAICAYSFRQALKEGKMTYEDLVRYAVEHKIDGLDLTVYWFPEPLTNSWLVNLKRLAYRNGVEIYSISIRTEMTQPTAELRQKELQEIRRWIDVALPLGAGHIRVFGGRVPKGATEEQAVAWAAEVLGEAARYAGEKGIILGLENHGGITERAETIIQIARKVNSPWVGINLDTGNFREDPYWQIEMCLPYAVNAQLKTEIQDKEGRRQESDWDRIFSMFQRAGYRGYLALEYEGQEPAESAVPRWLERLRELAAKYSA